MNLQPLFRLTNFQGRQKNDESLWNSWSRQSVAYQIYVRSFQDSNGDGIGDLQGIIDRLDYLNDGTSNSLGIGAIWLTPFFKSPMADFGYDISDYCDVDPIFGNLDDFERLAIEAHKRDIKIIIDFVSNHTSIEHPWFKESKSSVNNPKRDWYIWKKGKDGGFPNNWESVFGGSAWEFDETTGEYYLHSFLKEQPDLNWRNPEVQKAMLKVLDFWLEKGADGIRIDVANHLLKDEFFRDEPINPNYRHYPGAQTWHRHLHPYMRNRPEVLEVMNQLSKFVEGYGDKFIVTEANLSVPEMIRWHQACPNKRLSPLNFSFCHIPWQAKEFKKQIDNYNEAMDRHDLPCNFLSNHDRPRLTSRIGKKFIPAAAMLLLTLKGMPFIYYGEELGMEDVDVAPDEIRDEFGINNPGQGRDPERTPMPWDDSDNAGFSTEKPWLPVGQNIKINVKKQSKNYYSTLNLYRNLVQFRNSSKTLQRGSYRPIELLDEDVLIYERAYQDEKLLIVLNFTDVKRRVDLSSVARYGRIVFDTNLKKTNNLILFDEINLEPSEGLIIKI